MAELELNLVHENLIGGSESMSIEEAIAIWDFYPYNPYPNWHKAEPGDMPEDGQLCWVFILDNRRLIGTYVGLSPRYDYFSCDEINSCFYPRSIVSWFPIHIPELLKENK